MITHFGEVGSVERKSDSPPHCRSYGGPRVSLLSNISTKGPLTVPARSYDINGQQFDMTIHRQQEAWTIV